MKIPLHTWGAPVECRPRVCNVLFITSTVHEWFLREITIKFGYILSFSAHRWSLISKLLLIFVWIQHTMTWRNFLKNDEWKTFFPFNPLTSQIRPTKAAVRIDSLIYPFRHSYINANRKYPRKYRDCLCWKNNANYEKKIALQIYISPYFDINDENIKIIQL